MISFRELVNGFREVGLVPGRPVIVHASLSSFGEEVRGGVGSLLGALLAVTNRVMAPAFTYQTMLIPETGPENNALVYGSGGDLNRMAEFFYPDMPADRMMGALAEALRRHPLARRSTHPILSFAAIGLESALNAQTLEEPLAPLRVLAEMGGDVLLIGVDHRVNTSIHYAERMAGRRQFVRWALTPRGVVECPGFPGCSEGFNQIQPFLAEFTRQTQLGMAWIQAVALAPLLKTAVDLLHESPDALLCDSPHCERCHEIRKGLALSRLNSETER